MMLVAAEVALAVVVLHRGGAPRGPRSPRVSASIRASEFETALVVDLCCREGLSNLESRIQFFESGDGGPRTAGVEDAV